jgi:hypothetical protein
MQRWTISSDESTLTKCPGETKRGLHLAFDLNTHPTSRPLKDMATASPSAEGGAGYVPQRFLTATPIVGRWATTPTWDAQPQKRGCAIPCALMRYTVGASVRESMS